ncbi:MAG TPA: O-antigen ligase family protein [Ignavibacteriaceae bacterium]|nr:O-antigen ligase family protein [Ignavibacteriaceae bacterium]
MFSPYFKFKYFFIFYTLIRVPLHTFVFEFDSKGRIYFALMLVLLASTFWEKSKDKRLNLPIVIWGIWMIYALVNTLVQGMNFDMESWQFFYYLSAPLILIYLINLNKDITEFSRLLNTVTFSAYIGTLIVVFFETSRFYSGEGFRLGYTMNANEIGIASLFTLLFLYLNYSFNQIKFRTLLILALLPTYVVLLSGSRAAFIPFVFLFASHFFIAKYKNKIVKIPLLVIGVILFFALMNFIESNFIVMERIRDLNKEAYSTVNTGTVLDNLGSRAQYFYYGSEIFRRNPIWGIGLGNYRIHNPINRQPNHVEIMIQLSELGIIGFILFLTFNLWILRKFIYIWKNTKEQRKQTASLIIGFICILALSFTTYTYSNLSVFAYLGLIIAFIIRTDKIHNSGKDIDFSPNEQYKLNTYIQ